MSVAKMDSYIGKRFEFYRHCSCGAGSSCSRKAVPNRCLRSWRFLVAALESGQSEVLTVCLGAEEFSTLAHEIAHLYCAVN
jgi:hypothetical protein